MRASPPRGKYIRGLCGVFGQVMWKGNRWLNILIPSLRVRIRHEDGDHEVAGNLSLRYKATDLNMESVLTF